MNTPNENKMRFLSTTLLFILAASLAIADEVPEDSRELATRAKEAFDHGRYSDASKIYERILVAHPDSLYALSNLGVVQFKTGKIKLAEKTFKRAISVAPKDAFSHCTLGIVYYSQGLYSQAMSEFSTALEID